MRKGKVVDLSKSIPNIASVNDINMAVVPQSKFADSSKAFIAKPTHEIRLSKLLASQEALRNSKEATITLRDFIAQQYPAIPKEGNEPGKAFRCTIKDIGLHPFEIDIYDARIILVEVTGKIRKNFAGEEVPERLYRGRNYTMNSTLHDIADIMAKRKILGGESTIITLREYHNVYSAFYKYVCGIINKDYSKALNVMEQTFPFTQLSEGRSDEEDWFKK